MKRNWFHILMALADHDCHGSDIVRDVLEQTDGALRLWPATLYGTLEQLDRDGLILELKDELHPAGASEKRRYYRITPKGRGALDVESQSYARLASAAQARLEAG